MSVLCARVSNHPSCVFSGGQAYRIKRNRLLLRQPVSAIAVAGPGWGEDGVELLDVNCECSADDCDAKLMVPRSDFEQLMPEQRQLLIAIGHELDSPVHVSRRTEVYEIVELWVCP